LQQLSGGRKARPYATGKIPDGNEIAAQGAIMDTFRVSFTLLAILVFLGAPLCSAQESDTPSASQTVAPQGYPVLLGNQTLFTITQKVEGYLPEDRANGMSERIKRIADDPGIPVTAVKTVSFDIPLTIISAENNLLAAFSDQDAGAVGLTKEEIAAKYAEKLRIAVEAYRKERSLRSILIGTLYTVIATVALALILILLQRLYGKINATILSRLQGRIRSVQIQSFELVRADHLKAGLLGAVKFVRFFILLLVVYTYVQLVLGFFPWTRPFANEILDYVMAPVAAIAKAVAACAPDLLFIVILVIIAKYLLKMMKFFFLEVEKGTVKLSGFYPEWAKPTYRILSLLVVAFFAVVAFPFIPGSSSSAFKGISIFLGVLFSIGSQSAISNIIAGLVLTYRRVFRVGDWVKIAEFTGDVVEIRLQVTTLLTIKNEEVVIPNALILNNSVINYSARARDKGLILHTGVTIGYDAPWRKVHELLLNAAERTSGLLREPPPFVRQQSLDDFYVAYEVNAYTDNPQGMSSIYSELHENIQEAFNEGGVEILSPHYTQIRDGNKVTIPESYLPKDYAPAAFRIVQTGGAKGKDEQKEAEL
jgi:small-conductance mechanosensitive channel